MGTQHDDWERSIDAGWAELGGGAHDAAAATFGRVLAETREAGDADEERRFQAAFGLGVALSRLGRYDEAEALLLDALRLAPANGKVAQHLGENAMEHGHATRDRAAAMRRYQSAQNHFARARAMGVDDATLDYNTACMASRLGDHAEMLAALERAVARDESVRIDARIDPDFEPSLGVPALRRLLRM